VLTKYKCYVNEIHLGKVFAKLLVESNREAFM